MLKLRTDITYGNNVSWDTLDNWQKESNPWTVVLRYGKRRMSFPFWTGQACNEPGCFDAAYCVVSDSQGVENSGSFEAWCLEYGYDTDSRTAERIYKQCLRQARNLQRLLGVDYEEILSLDEEGLKRRCL